MYNLTTEEVFSEVKSNRNGLSNKEAKNRLIENGKNELSLTRHRSFIGKVAQQFNNIVCWVLFIALLSNIVLISCAS